MVVDAAANTVADVGDVVCVCVCWCVQAIARGRVARQQVASVRESKAEEEDIADVDEAV